MRISISSVFISLPHEGAGFVMLRGRHRYGFDRHVMFCEIRAKSGKMTSKSLRRVRRIGNHSSMDSIGAGLRTDGHPPKLLILEASLSAIYARVPPDRRPQAVARIQSVECLAGDRDFIPRGGWGCSRNADWLGERGRESRNQDELLLALILPGWFC